MSPTEVKVKPVEPPAAPTPASGSVSDPKPVGKARVLVPPRAPSSTKRQTKVLLSVADGKIEWEKMEPSARKQFEGLFSDPEFLKQFGLLPKSGDAFDPEQVKMLFDAVSTAYQTVCRFLMKWPPEALKLLAYSELQKDLLKKPTANLLNKLAPAILIKNQELMVFATVFFSVSQQNFTAARTVATEIRQRELDQKRNSAAASPHTTVPTGKVEVIPPAKPNGNEGVPITMPGVSFSSLR